MIYRNTKGLTFVEIIVSVAIISIIIMGSAQTIKYVMHSMANDRQEIKANNFSQMIIDDLKAKCVPETFYGLHEGTTADYENGSPRKFPNLRGDVSITEVSLDGRIEVIVTITFPNNSKESKYYVTLVKNSGLQPKGIISGTVVNYLTKKGIPGAEVTAPNSKVDGDDINCTTNENGKFTLTGVKVGTDIPITISKLGSCPNDLDNYDPGYYVDYDLIEEFTMKLKATEVYDNITRSNDSLYWTKSYDVQNNVVTYIGDNRTVYLCPMAIVRGWVKDEDGSGIGRIVVGIYNSGNFINSNSDILTANERRVMHPYYGNKLALLSDNASSGHYYVTTRDEEDEDYTNTYSVEGENINFSLAKGQYVFFNVRPGAETYLRARGRYGSNPAVQRYDPPDSTEDNPDFAWGYLRSTFKISEKKPYIIVKSYNIFNVPGSQYTGTATMEPYINELNDNHTKLPVTNSGYKYYQYGTCTHPDHDFNDFALSSSSSYEIKNNSFCNAEIFSQKGWNNYESITYSNAHYDNNKYPTCFVARRRGGIKGRIFDWQNPDTNNNGIAGITVRAKVWADTDSALSNSFSTQFSATNCVSVQTDSDGYFYLNNIYGMEQQFYATAKPNTSGLPTNWDGHIEAFKKACEDDTTSLQDYAVLRITNDQNPKVYMPRLVRAHQTSVFDHAGSTYPTPSWTNTNWMTDFGDIAMVNKSSGVIVTGYLVDDDEDGIVDAEVTTKSIFGLSMNSSDNAILGMNHAASIVTADTQTGGAAGDGFFQLNNVMPNFILLDPDVDAVNHLTWDTDQNQPRGSIQKFTFSVPGLRITNVRLEGTVTDYMTGMPIQDVSITANPTGTSFGATGGGGQYNAQHDMGEPGGTSKVYYEHLPADSSDQYVTDCSTITWTAATRTIHLGDIDGGTQNASRNITIKAEKTGYEYETKGEYLITRNATITTNFQLQKHYTIKYFGRVVDGNDAPKADMEILIRMKDSRSVWQGAGRPPRTKWGTNTFTNSNGYWGDWSQKEGDTTTKGTSAVEQTLFPTAKSVPFTRNPNWDIEIWVSGANAIPIDEEPTAWVKDGGGNCNEVVWQDGYSVYVGTITVPIITPPADDDDDDDWQSEGT